MPLHEVRERTEAMTDSELFCYRKQTERNALGTVNSLVDRCHMLERRENRQKKLIQFLISFSFSLYIAEANLQGSSFWFKFGNEEYEKYFHHQFMLISQTSLTLFQHLSLSVINLCRFSIQTNVHTELI